MRYFNLGALALLAALSVSANTLQAAGVEVEAGVNVSAGGNLNIGVFYDQLAPHGKWIEIDDLGWAWQPAVVVTDVEWRPYLTNGHWIYTDNGWYWDSNYDWGWATFHYGRWNHHDKYNWVWTPDTVWAPAWVSWRESDHIYGWAPLPHGARFEGGLIVGGGANVELRADVYNFVPATSFLSVNLNTVVVKREERERDFQQTKVINNSYTYNDNRVINNGVPVAKVAAATKQEIKPAPIADAASPAAKGAANGKVNAYRPAIKNDKPAAPPPNGIKAADAKAAAKPNEQKPADQKPVDPKANEQKPADVKTPAQTEQAKQADQNKQAEQAKQEQNKPADPAKQVEQNKQAEQAKQEQAKQTEQSKQAEQTKRNEPAKTNEQAKPEPAKQPEPAKANEQSKKTEPQKAQEERAAHNPPAAKQEEPKTNANEHKTAPERNEARENKAPERNAPPAHAAEPKPELKQDESKTAPDQGGKRGDEKH